MRRNFFHLLIAMLLIGAGMPVGMARAQAQIVHFSIPSSYTGNADSNVIISQFITDTLTSVSITSFSEYVYYNANVLQLVDVQNGDETPFPAWTVSKTITTPGIVWVSAAGPALHTPGEILKFFFFVLTQAQPLETSLFTDSDVVVGSPGSAITAVSDTGQLLVIDACMPLVGSGIVPDGIALEVTNPVSSIANISYFVPENSASEEAVSESAAHFRLYNAAGCLVRSIDNADRTAGWHTLQFGANMLSAGIYSLSFELGSARKVARFAVIH